jgi:hypothetical protein
MFAVDPNTVLQWLIEATDHLETISRYFLRDLQISQVQLDELFAWLSAVKVDEASGAEAIQR